MIVKECKLVSLKLGNLLGKKNVPYTLWSTTRAFQTSKMCVSMCVCLFFVFNWYVTPPAERRNIWVRISWDQCFLPHPCCFEHDSFLHMFTISEGTVILLCASCDLKYMSTQKWNIYFLNKGDSSLKLDICLILPGGGLCSPGTTGRWCLSGGSSPGWALSLWSPVPWALSTLPFTPYWESLPMKSCYLTGSF